MGLYTHEDSLNWNKLHNYFYLNGVLVAMIGLLIKPSQADCVSVTDHTVAVYGAAITVSVLGIVVSYLFRKALVSGVEYMVERKLAAIDVEKALIAHGGVRVLTRHDEIRSTTIQMIKRLSLIGLTRISYRSQETRLRGARDEIFGVWGRQRLSVGPP